MPEMSSVTNAEADAAAADEARSEVVQHSRSRAWEDQALDAVMNLRIGVFSALLRETPEVAALELQRHELAGTVAVYKFGQEAYVCGDTVNQALGGHFRFERAELRAEVGDWLDMIGCKTGDTLLHLALRLSGANEELKTRLVTELIGRGCSIEALNEAGELPAMVDQTCFRAAFFTELPKWRKQRAREAQQEELAATLAAAAEADAARVARREVRQQERDAREAAETREAARVAAEEQARYDYLEELDHCCQRVTMRQVRKEKRDDGAQELWNDVCDLMKVVSMGRVKLPRANVLD
jgi:hypothetical protein